jgi:hypothetical protein
MEKQQECSGEPKEPIHPAAWFFRGPHRAEIVGTTRHIASNLICISEHGGRQPFASNSSVNRASSI